MNEKEIAEIRRRLRPEKSNITKILGCYVNDKQEIVSIFQQSLALMPQEESEKMLNVLKRTLSGTPGKNLMDLSFSTQQVVDSDEHRLLMALRNSSLEDSDAVQAFYEKVIASLHLDSHYLILLAHDTYDVFYRSKDGERQDEASSEVYSYLLCSICPVKMTKPALCYYVPENVFHSLKTDWLVSPPELGFLFPAFDDRSANIYGALYYSKNIEESHDEFVDTIFRTQVPMPAAVQKEAFQSVLEQSLEADCNYEVVQSVHDTLCEMIEEHKANKEEPLVLSKTDVKGMLSACGVEESRVEAFEEKFDTAFGADAELSPRNLIDAKTLAIKTPDVTIQVNPERSDLLETRIIDGKKYILIRAEEGVEVNGIGVYIS